MIDFSVFDFNVIPKNFDGENIGETTLGKYLSVALQNTKFGDAMLFMDWAEALHKGQPIKIKDSDKRFLTRFIQETEGILPNYARKPIILILESK